MGIGKTGRAPAEDELDLFEHLAGFLVVYITDVFLDALERFEGMEQTQLAPLIMEMATLGEQGLPVNDPEKKFTLRLLPGEYTGLQVVCMMHVGMKKIDEVMDSSFDIDREYEAASATYNKQQQSD